MDARSIRSIISHEIWLGDHSGNSFAFARNVTINGWTFVGDQLAGAYIGNEFSFVLGWRWLNLLHSVRDSRHNQRGALFIHLTMSLLTVFSGKYIPW